MTARGGSVMPYTPGPWKIPPDDLAGQRRVKEKGLAAFSGRAVLGGDNKCVCIVLTIVDEAEANARLIAAAPDLLDALNFMANNWNSPFDNTRFVARQKGQTAIAKATGQPDD